MTKMVQHASEDVFTAIAHPVRRQILDLLKGKAMTVNRIAEPFHMSRPAVSQHLRVLLDAGLVVVREEGRLNYYHLRPEKLQEIEHWVSEYAQFWNDKLDALGNFLNNTEA